MSVYFLAKPYRNHPRSAKLSDRILGAQLDDNAQSCAHLVLCPDLRGFAIQWSLPSWSNCIEEELPKSCDKVVKPKQGGPAGRPVTGLSTFLVEKGARNREQSASVRTAKQMDRMIPASENRKGCDIGYAPAICSCERAESVDTCTAAALDAITTFAVPNPGFFSQSQPVFSGLVALQVALPSRSLSLLRMAKFYFANPFSRRRGTN